MATNTLDRCFDNWLPDHAWVAELTYIATAEGRLYLATIMELASRRIVDWSMSERMNAGLACQVLRLAYGYRQPPGGLLLYSDHSSQYASYDYGTLAADFGIQMSMSC